MLLCNMDAVQHLPSAGVEMHTISCITKGMICVTLLRIGRPSYPGQNSLPNPTSLSPVVKTLVPKPRLLTTLEVGNSQNILASDILLLVFVAV
jgi:hypothetical protein